MIRMLYLILIQPLLANPFGLDVGNINEALNHPAKVYPPWVSFQLGAKKSPFLIRRNCRKKNQQK